MSTSATASGTSYRVGIPADKAFNEIAFHDPTVCSRCFCLIRRRDTYRPDTDIGVSDYAPEERLRRAFNGGKGYKTESTESPPEWESVIPSEDYVYGYRPLHEPRTFCESCGSQSGRADDDSLSQRQAVIFASNLLDRLDEANVRASKRALKRLVKGLKSDPRVADYDTEIFRRATKVAIRHARR